MVNIFRIIKNGYGRSFKDFLSEWRRIISVMIMFVLYQIIGLFMIIFLLLLIAEVTGLGQPFVQIIVTVICAGILTLFSSIMLRSWKCWGLSIPFQFLIYTGIYFILEFTLGYTNFVPLFTCTVMPHAVYWINKLGLNFIYPTIEALTIQVMALSIRKLLGWLRLKSKRLKEQ